MDKGRLSSIWLISSVTVAGFIFISLYSFNINDIYLYSSSSLNLKLNNLGGVVGAYLAMALFFIIGKCAFFIPVLLVIRNFPLRGKEHINIWLKILSVIMFFISLSAFMSILFGPVNTNRFSGGGISGLIFSDLLIKYFNLTGAYIISISLMFLSALVVSNFLLLSLSISFINLLGTIFKAIWNFLQRVNFSAYFSKIDDKTHRNVNIQKRKKIILADKGSNAHKYNNDQRNMDKNSEDEKDDSLNEEDTENREEVFEEKPIRKITPRISLFKKRPVEKKINYKRQQVGEYHLPPIELLDSGAPISDNSSETDLQASAVMLEDTLADFGIEVNVTNVDKGPIITRYELQPAAGVKVNKITELHNDIALALKAPSVRIVAPIPGKSRVGIEVPNSKSVVVCIRDVLESNEFQNKTDEKLLLALGKDVSGNPLVTILSDFPHLLIAGATGAGKTVCINTLIVSLLYNATPDEVKLLMIDPKMVELAIYNGLPHLICPVVTDPKKVSGALNWAVKEMERRYVILAKNGTRNIKAYNKKVESNQELEKIPYIVIVIDELADLMMVASDKIETAITRLAQLSRAVGIHIILATQRPSVDVITGVIKANFPARISFKVTSKVDSRTVLDANGADKLIGKGDLLFMKPGASKLIRAQGCLISDAELERVVDFIKQQAQPKYNNDVLNSSVGQNVGTDEQEDDLFEQACNIVIGAGQASVSILQRRLRLGYTRAARIIDMMEARGIIGAYQGSKPREILVDNYSSAEKTDAEKDNE